MYLGDNLLKNGIRAIPKMIFDEKTDCVISLMPVTESRANQETGTAPCDGSTMERVDVQFSHAMAQFGSLIEVLVSAALVGTVGAVLVRRGRK